MGKQPDEGNVADAADCDWSSISRRPFRRGFVPYGNDASLSDAELKAKRQAYGIRSIDDPAGAECTPYPIDAFEEVGVVPSWLLEALRDNEWLEPSGLEAQLLPIALGGQSAIGISRGSASALCQLIPAIVHLDDQPAISDEDAGPIVLLISRNQESAEAIASQAARILHHSSRSAQHGPEGITVSLATEGGKKQVKQLKEQAASSGLELGQLRPLRSCGTHLLVATPGGAYKMAKEDKISLLRVTFLILDCADGLLGDGAEEHLRELASWVRPERQVVFLAQKWPQAMQDLASELCFAGGQPVRIDVTAPPLETTAKASKRAPPAGERAVEEQPPKGKAAKHAVAHAGSDAATADDDEYPEGF